MMTYPTDETEDQLSDETVTSLNHPPLIKYVIECTVVSAVTKYIII